MSTREVFVRLARGVRSVRSLRLRLGLIAIAAMFAGFLSAISFGPGALAAAGDLDPTFNGTGKLRIGFGNGGDGFARSVIQPDGKIVTTANTRDGDNYAVAVTRHNPDGSPDTTFGTGGRLMTDLGVTATEFPSDVLLQVDGKIVVVVPDVTTITVLRYNPNGTLDASFDGDGQASTPASASLGTGAGLIQADGKIVVGASASQDFLLLRFNQDGSVDTTFDGDGRVSTSFGGDDRLYALAPQSDGKILAGGYGTFGSRRDFVLARYNPDGSLDTLFGGDGLVSTQLGPSQAELKGLAIQPDGKIVAGGMAFFETGRSDFTAVRYNPDGSTDSAFDGDGVASVAFGPDSGSKATANSVALQPDGKIVLAGFLNFSSQDLNYQRFAIARLNANGSIDNSFDGDGRLVPVIDPRFTRSNDVAFNVDIQLDSRIVVTGSGSILGNTATSNGVNNVHSDIALVRLDVNGALDTSFGGDGIANADVGHAVSLINAMAVQPDGKIVAAGYAARGSLGLNNGNEFAVARINPDGTLDTTFDGDGRATTLVGTLRSEAAAVTIQPDGKIIAAGSYSTTDANSDFALVRYNPDGSLDTGFDGDGRVMTVFSSERDAITSIALQPDGKIVVAGSSVSSGNKFTLARYNPNGSLDTTFDGDGKVITGVGTAATTSDRAEAIVIQGDGTIVAAGTSSSNFAVVRYNPSGSLDTTFDTDGRVTTDFGSTDNAYALALQPDGKLVAAGSASLTFSDTGFALARYNPNGSLDTTFECDGKVVSPITPNTDEIRSILLQPDGGIVAGGFGNGVGFGSSADIAVVRYNTFGAIDPTFGGDGSIIFDFGGAVDRGFDIAFDASGRILVGGQAIGTFGIARILGGGARPSGDLLDGTDRPSGDVCVNPTPTPSAGSIAGTVTYGTTPAGQAAKFVPGVMLVAAGSTPRNASTSAAGTYSITNLGTGAYTVTPTKSPELNGISGLDAARVAQHVAGLVLLTPNQQLAGDATNNGSLSGLDAARIAQTVAGLPNSGITGQWKFLPASRSYASVTSSLANENYEAILIGDVTGNWTATAPRGEDARVPDDAAVLSQTGSGPERKIYESHDPNEIEIMLPAIAATKRAGEVTVPVSIGDTSGRGIVAYDVTLTYDPDLMRPADVPIETAGTLSDGWSVTINTQTPGEIRLTAFSATEMTGKGSLLNLRFALTNVVDGVVELKWRSMEINEGEVRSRTSNGRLIVNAATRPPSRAAASERKTS
jgi:uncharacterized delta-60 repeat protein